VEWRERKGAEQALECPPAPTKPACTTPYCVEPLGTFPRATQVQNKGPWPKQNSSAIHSVAPPAKSGDEWRAGLRRW